MCIICIFFFVIELIPENERINILFNLIIENKNKTIGMDTNKSKL
jgi:hypothetical protein